MVGGALCQLHGASVSPAAWSRWSQERRFICRVAASPGGGGFIYFGLRGIFALKLNN